jgi:hypothetical protein
MTSLHLNFPETVFVPLITELLSSAQAAPAIDHEFAFPQIYKRVVMDTVSMDFSICEGPLRGDGE